MASESWLILPTYNEADNLAPLVRACHEVLTGAAPDGHRILVVDDDSPDGTGDIADRLSEEIEEVSVLHRAAKGGLAGAYLAGFARALENGAARVMEMDSDFSHDPADLARLIAATEDHDLALGSRYVEGGGVINWGRTRRVVSRSGCWYAQHVLGIGVRDLTGGFKCFRREVLEGIDLPSVRSSGYAFQVELTYRALRAGFSVKEIPILFHERRAGDSKMSPAIALEAVWLVPVLRARQPGA